MRIAIMGTGGVGGYFGGLLAHSGQDVTFIARGDHLRAIQQHGLRVESPHGDFTVAPAEATDDPTTVGSVNLVLMCVKGWDTAGAAQLIKPLVGPDTAVISLQNGVLNEDILIDALGAEPVLGGTCYISSEIAAPGLIRHKSQMRRVIFGELDGRITPRAERILAAFQRSGATVELTTNIRKAQWTKFLFICAASGMSAVTRSPIGPMLECPETRELYIKAMREIEAVGRALGVNLDDDVVERTLAFSDGLEPELKPSMLVDLERGKRLELDAQNGAVVRLGRRVGVPTPVNEFITRVLTLADRKARDLSTY